VSRLRPTELTVGDKLGPYRLEQLLGEGGMGLVFRAVHESSDDVAALKVLKAELTEDEIYRQRFVHEARSAAEVHHPHLVPILDAGDIDGRSYLATAFVDGTTLEERVQSNGPLPVSELVRVIGEIGAGLDALHEHHLIHRDVKSANILVAGDGTALLSDFGLAKGRAYTVLTRPGQVMGTLHYLAPELIRGRPATPASDLYALGCVAFECATGKPPFSDRSVLQVGMAHLDEEPPDPGTGRAGWPAALSGAIVAALEKEPDARPTSAGAYGEGLRAAAGDAG
jgi:serine/threonine-protein kinase